MKKTYSLLLLLLIVALGSLSAENYPYRNDYLWVAVPNHADWLYRLGERTSIDVQLYQYGMPVEGEVSYTLADDMLEPTQSGTIQLKNGKGQISFAGRKNPGFVDIVMRYGAGSARTSHHMKVGYDVEHIQPWTQMPKDFSAWWQSEIDALNRLPLYYSKELAAEYSTDKVDCYLVKLQVDKKHSVYAYLFYPKHASVQSHPVVLCPPGAGVKTIKEPNRHAYYAEQGCIRMEMEIHGLDPRLSSDTFKDISAAFNPTNQTGYLGNGLDSREQYYMRHVYLALIRAIDLLTSLPEWDGKNVIVQGGSQGGALSLVAAALDKRVTLCVANHPALTDMGAYVEKGRTGGYPHFNHVEGMLTKEHLQTLAYYDVINFARLVTCPVYLTWGYCDSTCPPTTSYALWNTLTCPKESLITPACEHWVSVCTEHKQLEWIQQHLK